MKMVVFAHTPPPLHGQSYMVQLMLDGFGGDRRRNAQNGAPAFGIECYHVNAQLSKNLEDIGMARGGKLFALLGHCLQAVWCRFRYGASTLYYVPAPGKQAALYRDWLVMAFCRPFFKRVVFHWHATSLAKWLELASSIQARTISFRLMGRVDLSIALSNYNRFNAEKLWPRRLEVVPNGIPDPCPGFDDQVLPARIARLAARRSAMDAGGRGMNTGAQVRNAGVLRALFLAHCTREKGLFDAVHAVFIANEELEKRKSPLRIELDIAGTFQDAGEKQEFETIMATHPGAKAIRYVGFVKGDQKTRMLCEADLLCFPSHWENQPVSVIEALAFGLPVVISALPSVIEMLPDGYPAVAELRNPRQIAESMIDLADFSDFETLRRHFSTKFTLDAFHARLAEALKKTEQPLPVGVDHP